jgi:hypothetical protein
VRICRRFVRREALEKVRFLSLFAVDAGLPKGQELRQVLDWAQGLPCCDCSSARSFARFSSMRKRVLSTWQMPGVSPASSSRQAAVCVASSGSASIPTVAIAANRLMSRRTSPRASRSYQRTRYFVGRLRLAESTRSAQGELVRLARPILRQPVLEAIRQARPVATWRKAVARGFPHRI